MTFLVGENGTGKSTLMEAVIDVLTEAGVREVPCEETEHDLVTRGFLSNLARTLDVLFHEPNDEP